MNERLSRRLRRALIVAGVVFRFVLLIGVVGFAGWFSLLYFPDAYNPFEPPDLREPPNFVTPLKLRGLKGEYDICMSVIRASGARAVRERISSPNPDCGTDEGLRLQQSLIPYGDAVRITCPLAAALLMWERHVVVPAAEEHLGSPVVRIRHFGTYACRNVNHAESGPRSQHATANAIDIQGFDLADGRRITLSANWGKDSAEARFLEAVHNGGCGIFSGALGPGYNALHADHFHFDMGRWGVCR